MVYHSPHMVPLLLVSAFLSVGFLSMWAINGGTPPPRPNLKPQMAPLQPVQPNTTPGTASSKDAAIPDDGQTTWKCHARGPWSDFCEYKNVCFDSFGQLVFVFKDGSKADKRWSVRNPGMKMATKIPLSGMSENRVFPVHYSGEGYRIVTPDELDALKPTWTASSSQPGKGLYVTAYTDELGNIWYYSTRILPLFTAERERETLGLPEIGEVIIPMRKSKIDHDWHLKVLKLALPSDDIPVHYAEDAPYFGLSATPDGQARDKLICGKRVVLLGANVYGFTDMMAAHEFRVKTYKFVGLPEPPIQPPTDTSTISRNVTVLDRARKAPRHITNLAATLDVVRKYGKEPNHVVIEGEMTFEEQVRMMASTGVLVTVHGAGLMNQIFMQPGAATIEIFPDHMKHVLYERVAHYANLHHFKVYATEHPKDIREKHPTYFTNNCDKMRGLEIPNRPMCWHDVKNMVVVVPIREFEVALAHALDFIDRTPLLPVEATQDTE